MKNSDPAPGPAPFTAFEQLTRKLIAVPKAEVKRREAEYKRKQAKKPKRGPKPKAS